MTMRASSRTSAAPRAASSSHRRIRRVAAHLAPHRARLQSRVARRRAKGLARRRRSLSSATPRFTPSLVARGRRRAADRPARRARSPASTTPSPPKARSPPASIGRPDVAWALTSIARPHRRRSHSRRARATPAPRPTPKSPISPRFTGKRSTPPSDRASSTPSFSARRTRRRRRRRARKRIAAEIAARRSGRHERRRFRSARQGRPARRIRGQSRAPPPFVRRRPRLRSRSGGAMDAVFAKAAFALGPPGTPAGTSGVVESTFGWHVIRAIARIPPKQSSLESRRARFADEVLARRGHEAMKARIEALRASTKPGIMTDAESLMSGIARDISAKRRARSRARGAKPATPPPRDRSRRPSRRTAVAPVAHGAARDSRTPRSARHGRELLRRRSSPVSSPESRAPTPPSSSIARGKRSTTPATAPLRPEARRRPLANRPPRMLRLHRRGPSRRVAFDRRPRRDPQLHRPRPPRGLRPHRPPRPPRRLLRRFTAPSRSASAPWPTRPAGTSPNLPPTPSSPHGSRST